MKKRIILFVILSMIGAFWGIVGIIIINLPLLLLFINDYLLFRKYYNISNNVTFPLIIDTLTSNKPCNMSFLFNLDIDIIWPLYDPSIRKNKIVKLFALENARKFKKKGLRKFSSKLMKIETILERKQKECQKNNKKERKEYRSYDNIDMDLQQCFTILNIPQNSTAAEIKKAYKKKISKTHPDKVSHLSKEIQEIAKKDALKINKAYQKIMNTL